MPKIITYSAVKAQIQPWHQVVHDDNFYTLDSFRRHCLKTQTWEYGPGTVKLYDTRHKTFHGLELVEDPTPESTPEGPVIVDVEPADDEADADLTPPDPEPEPAPDFSVPPPGFVPGPVPPLEPVIAETPPVDQP